ncbi:MAG: DUF371 domain-containing protein [Candidatus Helarchaeota archaeon]
MTEKIIETFFVFGHKNITAKHKTTIEFTRENYLTKNGDCIIGINSEKGLIDFNDEFRKLIKSDDAKITCTININDLSDTIIGKGSPKLSFNDSHDIVIRKSNYVCDRTVMIGANKAAIDIDRRIIQLLKNHDTKMKVIFQVEI